MEAKTAWVVTQNGQIICSPQMGLNRRQAENKVENELRLGNFMEDRHATKAEINPPNWIEEECDD